MRRTSLAVIGALALAMAGTGSASAQDYASVFHLRETPNGQVIDVPNHSAGWGQPLQLWPYNGGTNQMWREASIGAYRNAEAFGFFSNRSLVKISNVENGLCMEAPGTNPTEGAVIQQYGCDPNFVNQPNQLWFILEDLHNGRRWFVNEISFARAGAAAKLQINSFTNAIEVVNGQGASWPALVISLRPGDRRLVLDRGYANSTLQYFMREAVPVPAPAPAPPAPAPGCSGLSCLVSPNG
jgi:hypothetical protein